MGLGGESENGSESWKQSTFLWPPEKSTFFVRRRGRARETQRERERERETRRFIPSHANRCDQCQGKTRPSGTHYLSGTHYPPGTRSVSPRSQREDRQTDRQADGQDSSPQSALPVTDTPRLTGKEEKEYY